ncbi:MAG: protein kinase family protein [Deltaproteobacteria bacterium]|nr:protein kinase family protein [Deltaproteobacteria bacterium]TLN01377.1 MAG: protein kinase family protein [bacterium]
MVMRLFARDKVYSPQEAIGEYTVLDVIGEGRYGICYLACKDSNRFILKQLKNRISKKAGNNCYFEEEILQSIDHERIPRLISKISTTKFKGYVLEYKEGKTFEELIYNDNRIFQTEEILEIGFQIIQILKYLHSSGVIHRDIRVPNTIYNKGKVYLVDFGLARWVDNQACTADIDFSYLGDFLLHLHYTTFESNNLKPKPWFEELVLPEKQSILLKRLLGIEKRYDSIEELEKDYRMLKA